MKNDASVRKTLPSELARVMPIYDHARLRMAACGNPNQWIDGYPSADIIKQDITLGNHYSIFVDGRLAGVFTFIIGADPTYDVIDGRWLNDEPYGTIHRIAAAPQATGIADICLTYCLGLVPDIRIDTHEDNAPMRGWIESRGFSYCGIIRCHNGSPRRAYHFSGATT